MSLQRFVEYFTKGRKAYQSHTKYPVLKYGVTSQET